MNARFASVAFVLIATSVLAIGRTDSAPLSGQFPRFTLKEGQLDADGLPVSGAKLCVVKNAGLCYQMPPETYDSSDSVKYQFGLEPRAERLALTSGGSWIFFSAVFSAGGSGTLTRFAVLRYIENGRVGRIENLLPWVGATNVSDWAMWALPEVSVYPVLVAADFVWGKEETHFAPHFFVIRAWRFNPNSDRYAKVFEYQTTKKYGGGDSAPVRVLGPEREEIIRRLESN